jgi:transposase
MEGGLLVMSQRERSRLVMMSRVREKAMTIKESSEVMGVSYRQGRRIHKRYTEEGDKGLIHRNRGQPSNRSKPPEVKEAVIALYRERYWDFGPTLVSEKLLERDGYQIDHETVRRWLSAAGLWERQRKRPKHRKQRERKAHFGELVQIDGSHHSWFEVQEEKACLMDMVDDATGETLVIMSKEETTVAAMQVLWAWVEKYGIPKALYVDRKTVYIAQREPTLEEQLSGELPLTQFGKACQKLGIEIVAANSPQAKGRVERKHGVYQDRGVKELRLEGIRDIEAANQFLPGFAESLNAKFAVQPRSSADYHQPVPDGLDMRSVFCLEETRTIGNDWVVRYKNRFLQIVSQSNLPPAKNRVTVQEHLDGSIHLVYRNREVSFREIKELPQKQLVVSSEKAQTTEPKRKYTPPQDHPWRKSNPQSVSKRVPSTV